jgi:DNA-binding response OmpR family regulator
MKKVVLIADSEPRCYSQLRHKLIADNCGVFHAASIEDAVKHFDIRTADLLIVDLDVPGDSIGSALSQVAQFNPGVRIIGVTERSEGSEIAVRECLDGIAEKPFAIGSLITFVHELFKNPAPSKEFRYLNRAISGLHAGASHRSPRVWHHPPLYRGWGINE